MPTGPISHLQARHPEKPRPPTQVLPWFTPVSPGSGMSHPFSRRWHQKVRHLDPAAMAPHVLGRVVQDQKGGECAGVQGRRGHARDARSCQLCLYMSLMCSTRSASVKSKHGDTWQTHSRRVPALSPSNPSSLSRTLRFHDLEPTPFASGSSRPLHIVQ